MNYVDFEIKGKISLGKTCFILGCTNTVKRPKVIVILKATTFSSYPYLKFSFLTFCGEYKIWNDKTLD